MKNRNTIYNFIFIQIALILITIIITISCEKDEAYYSKKILGTWISTDLIDTIEFATDNNLYKRIYGIKDHFDYSCTKDSITIRYNGVLYVLVHPTTHPYQLIDDELTIDFRAMCYGFREQIITFERK